LYSEKEIQKAVAVKLKIQVGSVASGDSGVSGVNTILVACVTASEALKQRVSSFKELFSAWDGKLHRKKLLLLQQKGG
jgi:hypothetical protein